MKHFFFTLFPLFSTLALTAAVHSTDWCQKSFGCKCSNLVDCWECKKDGKVVAVIYPPKHTEPMGLIECNGTHLRQLASFNLTLGKVQHLELDACDISGSTYLELFEAMALEGLEGLKIDMGEDSFKRPLESRAFQDFSQRYPDLKRLDLDRISVLDEDVLNPLVSLKTVTFKHCKNISALSKDSLRSLVNLEHFEMYLNSGIKTIPDGFFEKNVQLRVLNLSTNGLVSLPPNLLWSLVNLEEVVLNSNFIDNIPEDLFANNVKLKILMWNQDYCSKDKPCIRTFPSGLFASTLNLETFTYSHHLSKDKGTINGVSFEAALPRSLKSLVVAGTRNLTLSTFAFLIRNLESLEYLSLPNNNLMFVDDRFIKSVPKSVHSLDVTGNKIDCRICKILTFSGLVIDKCFDGNASQDTINKSDLTKVLKLYCNTDHVKLYILIGVIGIFVLVTVFAVLAVCVSEQVRVRLYHHKFFANFFLPESDFEGKDFDVFISYAEEDADLAMTMVDKLEGAEDNNAAEKQGRIFRCCLHQRDWTAGREISQNIVDSVNRSRRTVIILSRAFLQSSYCLQEFNQAYAQNRLLMVMRVDGDTKEVAVVADDMQEGQFDAIRSYIETFTYLREDDSDFWKKLVYRLPHKRISALSNVVKNGRKPMRRISELRRLISYTSREDDKDEISIVGIRVDSMPTANGDC